MCVCVFPANILDHLQIPHVFVVVQIRTDLRTGTQWPRGKIKAAATKADDRRGFSASVSGSLLFVIK